MSTLNPIAIATIGYVCDSVINPIARGTHGYVCLGVTPPTPEDPFGGGMGHGAVILEPQPYIEPETKEDEELLAILAVIAINQYYD